MKLYTEKQVRKAHQNGRHGGHNEDWYKTDDYIDSLTPIELPSDDDICDEAESIARVYYSKDRSHHLGLEEGAKRMAYWLMKHFKQQDNGNT